MIYRIYYEWLFYLNTQKKWSHTIKVIILNNVLLKTWDVTDTISSLELKNKNLLEEIQSLRDRQYDLIQNYSSSHNVLNKSIKCDQCDILKNKQTTRPLTNSSS